MKIITRYELQKIAEEKGFPYVAMDEDRKWHGYDDEPIVQNGVWFCGVGYSTYATGNYILDKDTQIQYSGDWKDSLTCPEGYGKDSVNSKLKVLEGQLMNITKEIRYLRDKDTKKLKPIEFKHCLNNVKSKVYMYVSEHDTPTCFDNVELVYKGVEPCEYDVMIASYIGSHYKFMFLGYYNDGVKE